MPGSSSEDLAPLRRVTLNGIKVLNVLIVDDNHADLAILKAAWAACSIVESHVDVLDDANLVMDYLLRRGDFKTVETPDLVLMDYCMPLGGVELLSKIRDNQQTAHMVVVVITGSCSPKDVFDSYRCHANGCFQKPNSFDEVVELLEDIARYWRRASMPHGVLKA